MKKAFIFKPSENWRYCGGGMVILADTFEEAKEIGKVEELQNLYRNEKDIDSGNLWNNWVLVSELNCSEESESKIVLSDYNWG
jgi:hypothetical protein